jgi:chromosome segregation protein
MAAAGQEVTTAEAAVTRLAEAVRGDEADEGPEPEAQDAEQAEREILRLERRVTALGPVNALAPEQLEELGGRAETARLHRDDLGEACADVRALCAHLAAASDRRFDAVFEEVSRHFQELFGELFPAGKAALRLESPAIEAGPDSNPATPAEEPAAPGVEIMAQPPGKRLQPLSLLSGGERALTALAVILALQQVNPSPFYVFDEVDAALDDSNVVRFTRLLARLGDRQQFIVVTHNHITMAAADALYGVTIDGEGTSSILSVRLAARDEGPQSRIVAIPKPSVEAAV